MRHRQDLTNWGTRSEKLQTVITVLAIYAGMMTFFAPLAGIILGLQKARELMEKVEEGLESQYPGGRVWVKVNVSLWGVLRGEWKQSGKEVVRGNLNGEEGSPLPPYKATETTVRLSNFVVATQAPTRPSHSVTWSTTTQLAIAATQHAISVGPSNSVATQQAVAATQRTIAAKS